MPKTIYSVNYYDAEAHAKAFGVETTQFFNTKIEAMMFASDVDSHSYETHQLCSPGCPTYHPVGSTLI